MQFYNTLTRTKEEFVPIDPKEIRMYTCGPTVNNYAHIGNLRSYVFADILQKTLEYSGFEVKRVMNITDIGILSSDADSGEDKMTAALIREGKELTLPSMRELAEFYADKFKEDLKSLSIKEPAGIYFASDYVKEDAELVEKLEEKGYAYQTSDGIYFDTARMPDYGVLTGGKTKRDEEHARITENPEKKNPEDFALWKFNTTMGYESKWGRGFPGWHLECSAIGLKFLGEQFDIHTGGIDLIPTHHTNEIAQSESATGKKPFVKFWLHSEHVDMANQKMAKSAGNFVKLGTIIEKGINPLAYRFWLLMAHYHTKMNFNWEALEASEVALKRLYRQYLDLRESVGSIDPTYQQKFRERISDDLDTPRAISLLWDLTKDEKVSDADKKATILDFDKVLSLGFANLKEDEVPEEIQKLVLEREEARKNKDWERSDEIRGATAGMGYQIEDTDSGPKVSKI
ncbi:MAG: cysteine--tRNA ligase [Candidatus Pacebacteria bacterium]|nr:cysteine--tRNA ligase [Candidatus Paceibacterota bacterium]MBP9851544.1 cysteine--tRNA ligase [Candidatus Paceibacterota bacterium]